MILLLFGGFKQTSHIPHPGGLQSLQLWTESCLLATKKTCSCVGNNIIRIITMIYDTMVHLVWTHVAMHFWKRQFGFGFSHGLRTHGCQYILPYLRVANDWTDYSTVAHMLLAHQRLPGFMKSHSNKKALGSCSLPTQCGCYSAYFLDIISTKGVLQSRSRCPAPEL